MIKVNDDYPQVQNTISAAFIEAAFTTDAGHPRRGGGSGGVSVCRN